MPVQGQPRRYAKKFMFAVEIDGLEVAWFSKASGLEAEADVVEQHEGGDPVVADESPGKIKYADIVLEVGVTDNTELYDWWSLVHDAINGIGEEDDDYKKNVAIIQKNRHGQPRWRFEIDRAWIKKYVGSDFDASASENAVEQVTLRYRKWKRVAA
jgi:phage tail-like protein